MKARILVFNCGSSSLKYKLVEMPRGEIRIGGEAQRVGPPTAEPSVIIHSVDGIEERRQTPLPDHQTAFSAVMKWLEEEDGTEPDLVAHRVVHGGSVFSAPTFIDGTVVRSLQKMSPLAPLHNPPAVALMESCYELYPALPQVAVFDTSFHSRMPAYAYTYPLAKHLRDELHIRKYGFHGISHRYVVEQAAAMMGIPLARFSAVSCHLGSGGASLCAVVKGRSVDTSMGFSPLQGLVMSTRCGDLDPAIALAFFTQMEGAAPVLEKFLNKQSGVLGLSGFSADIRDVVASYATDSREGERLQRTIQIYLWRIRKYLGAYLAVTKRADAVIFTDTIGETVPLVRLGVCADMRHFGLAIDPFKNAGVESLPADISMEGSPVRTLVVQTNEELAIAREAYSLMKKPGQNPGFCPATDGRMR
jgi:acetate kinase